MMRKQLCLIGTFAICFMLTGCCLTHEWEEATCAEAKHCSVCGETEGEPLEHTLTLTFQFRCSFRVPKGYDRLVIAVVEDDSSTSDDDTTTTGKIDTENVCFRLK